MDHIQAFDAHCHFGKWGPNTIEEREIDPFIENEMRTPEDVFDFLEHKGIAGVVLVPTYCPPEPTRPFSLNSEVLRCAEVAKGRIIPCFWVDPSPTLRRYLASTLKLATDNGIRVLKISASAWPEPYSADPETWDAQIEAGVEAIMDYARSKKCVVQVHTGGSKSDIAKVEKLVRRFPNGIKYHLVHMGGRTNRHFFFVPRFVEWLKDGLDIVCDTSGAAGFAVRWIVTEAAKDELIAERIMFASDEPWCTFDAELAKVLDATQEYPDLREQILFRTARRIYFEKGTP